MCSTLQADHHTTSSFDQICTLLLQSPQYNSVQDAATFSRLLCVSNKLREVLLHAAVGCIQAHVPRCCSSASTDRCFEQWLIKQWACGTLKSLHVEADDFYPDLCMLLAEQLQEMQMWQQQLELPGGIKTPGQQQLQQACSLQLAGPSCRPPAAATLPPAAVWSRLGASRRTPSIHVSWHVCGLPSSLPMLPGASLTHLTLRASTLTPATVNSLALLSSLQQLHLPNLNPAFGSLAPALSALTALTRLFIRHPCRPEQQALPTSLQQLTVAQRTPPWFDYPEGPQDLEPLQISHLTSLTNLTVHEVVPQGITEQYSLPTSLQKLAVVCISCAAPLLRLKQLGELRISSLKHSHPVQLLQLSSLPALTALRTGCSEEHGAAASSVRLAHADLRAYRQVFAAVPVYITALTVQEDAEARGGGLCRSVLRALCSLKGLRSLNLSGLLRGRAPAHQRRPEVRGDVTAIELAGALRALTELTQLGISHLQLARGCCCHMAAHRNGDSNGGFAIDAASATPADSRLESQLLQDDSNNGSRATAADAEGSQSSPMGLVGGAKLLGLCGCAAGHDAQAASWYCCRCANQQGWHSVLSSLAQLRCLRKLTCKGLPLGSAVSALSAVVQLQTLELRDCDVPPAVVAGLAACLHGREQQ